MNKITKPETLKTTPVEKTEGMSLPFFQKELTQLQRDLDRMFHDFWGKGRTTLDEFTGILRPDVDQSEDAKNYHVTMELPGLDEKDVEVSYADGMLTIKGEKREETETGDKEFYRKERTFGSFQRTFTLPGAIDEEAIEAHVDKGVLTVTLPKAPDAESKTRRIAVKKKS